ncbi:MAG: hypothetical protein U0359_21000 [Byssovorax sp.]
MDTPSDDRSSSWPLFQQSAADLATKLLELKGPEAASLAREAGNLSATFAGWQVNRPTSEARIAAIQQLFDLNRRAQDYLAKHGRSPASKNTQAPISSKPAPSSSKPTPRR